MCRDQQKSQANISQIKAVIAGLCAIISLSACSANPSKELYDTRISFAGTSCSANLQEAEATDTMFSWTKRGDGITTGFSMKFPFQPTHMVPQETVENPCQRIIDSASAAAESEKEMVRIEAEQEKIDLELKQLELQQTKAESRLNLLDLDDRYKTMKEEIDFDFE